MSTFSLRHSSGDFFNAYGQTLRQIGSAVGGQQNRDDVSSPSVSSPSPAMSIAQDRLARQWGFISYLEMFEASTPVPGGDGKHWSITAISGGGWILWNDEELVATEVYPSSDQAAKHAPGSPLV